MQSGLGLVYSGCYLHRKQKKTVDLLTTLAMGLSGLCGQLYTSLTHV